MKTQARGVLGGNGKEVAGVEEVVKENVAKLYKESKGEGADFTADFKAGPGYQSSVLQMGRGTLLFMQTP